MPAAQNLKSHARYDPGFHFVIVPILLVNLVFAFILCFGHYHQHLYIAVWWIVLSFTFILMALRARMSALKAQDRVIRLEERLRLTALLPSSEHATISSFTTAQLIALRFASDRELSVLARRTLGENLSPNQIKQSIVEWRPDFDRV